MTYIYGRGIIIPFVQKYKRGLIMVIASFFVLAQATILVGFARADEEILPTDLTSETVVDQDKVTLCHRTDDVKKPYVKITVKKSGVDGQGQNDHTLHTGPIATSEAIAQAIKDNHEEWGDIVPPFDDFLGLNWTEEGMALCNGTEQSEEVFPAAVTFTDATCDKSGFYTVPTTEHVTYTVNGSEVAAGDYDVANGSGVTVVAVADEGFFIDEETTSTWTHTFNAASGCGEVLSEQVTKTPKGAANAGAGGGSVMTGSLIGLVSSAFLGLAGFLGRKWSLNQ